jgi:predicted nucleic acid-binding Zn finger protein
MSKKDDLKLVFDFIAEYLKGNEDKGSVSVGSSKHLLVEEPYGNIPRFQGDVLTKLKTPVDSIGGDAAHIKNLMDRVEAKSVDQAYTTNLLNNQRKEFEQEIKKLKEKISEDLKTEKLNEQGIIVSGNTTNIINENSTEKVIVDNGVLKSIFEKKVEK